jgi:hypothetical protein
MTLAESASLVSVCVSSIAMAININKENIGMVPIPLWSIHLLSCCITALFHTEADGLVLLIWAFTFFSVLLDSHYAKLHAQIFLLFLSFVIIVLRIGISKIISIPNGAGWLIQFGIFLLLAIPLLIGMNFFSELRRKGLSPFAIAALLSIDYSVGAAIGILLMKHN